MKLADYVKFIREHADNTIQKVLQPPCEKCGRNTIFEVTPDMSIQADNK